MRIAPLTKYDLPDLADHLVHFTGRLGTLSDVVDADILSMSPSDRLRRILDEGRIRAFSTYSSGGPFVAFTESTPAAVHRLIGKRYRPWGIGFTKQFVFDQGGAPVLYVRGDEWAEMTSQLPDHLRTRLVRFWPGAATDPGEGLGTPLRSRSEWLHEREWRVRHDVVFDWDAIAFLIVPDARWCDAYAAECEQQEGGLYAAWFDSIPLVVIDDNGRLVSDQTGLWQ